MMLKTISWEQYLKVLLIIISAYYLVVLAIYFRRDFFQWLVRKSLPSNVGQRAFLDREVNQGKVVSTTKVPQATKGPENRPEAGDND